MNCFAINFRIHTLQTSGDETRRTTESNRKTNLARKNLQSNTTAGTERDVRHCVHILRNTSSRHYFITSRVGGGELLVQVAPRQAGDRTLINLWQKLLPLAVQNLATNEMDRTHRAS